MFGKQNYPSSVFVALADVEQTVHLSLYFVYIMCRLHIISMHHYITEFHKDSSFLDSLPIYLGLVIQQVAKE